jgi:hypothetical protein
VTAWEFLNNSIHAFPPVAFSLLLAVILAAAVVCVVGFARHGVNFLKYGFKQLVLDSSLEKRFDDLNARFDGIHDEIGGIHNEIGDLRNEIGGMHNEIGDLRNEIGGIHGEIGDLRNEIGGIHGEIDNIHGKIDRMGREFRTELGDLRGELKTIKVNHFGHLKSYLGVLNGILLDKGVIDNESKARLDNELRDM